VRVSCVEPTKNFMPAQQTAPIVYVCITCRGPDEAASDACPGALLADSATAAAVGTDVEVRKVRCLANCSRGPSAAVRCAGSWTYVFGGLDVTCGADLVTGARLLGGADDGIMPWRGRPEPLKRGLIARVPPLDFAGDGE
jgi:predicted metal-binding protein